MQPAEIGLIGSILLDELAYDRVSHRVQAIDFECMEHRAIWQAIEALASTGIKPDYMTVADQLDRDGRLGMIGGMTYLMQISQSTPSASRLEQYAKQVHDRAALRHLSALCRDIAEKCDAGEMDADGLALEAETRIHKLATAKNVTDEFIPLNEALVKALDYCDSRQSGEVNTIKTGLWRLDAMIGGFLRGSLNILAARPSQGKTAMGLTMTLGASADDKQIAFVSIEMPAYQIGMRIIGMETGVPVQSMIRGELDDDQWMRISAKLGQLQERGIHVADASAVSIPSIRAMVSRQKRSTGLDLLIVDYLQLIQPPKIDSREQQVAAMSAGLKAIAKEFDIAVVCLAQLNREAAGRRPRMSDIRESGAVEQDADTVMLIHRQDNDGVPEREAELIVDKNRNGETGIVMMEWAPEQMRFFDYDPSAQRERRFA